MVLVAVQMHLVVVFAPIVAMVMSTGIASNDSVIILILK